MRNDLKKIIVALGALLVVGGLMLVFVANQTKQPMGITQERQEANAKQDPVPLAGDNISHQAAADKKALANTEKIENVDMVTPTTSLLQEGEKLALLANGCFWCVEHDLEPVWGVLGVVSGYAGGSGDNPTYKNYIELGHKEVVLVTYDSSKVSYANLVEHIIKHGDPTDADGSFNDRGLQYAPAIYYENDAEKAEARRVIEAVDEMKLFPKPLPIALLPTSKFWPAEEYHQDYAEKNPLKYGYYRTGSGRTAFIEQKWGERLGKFEVKPLTTSLELPAPKDLIKFDAMTWNNFVKPTVEELKNKLTPLQYQVTQEEGTEPARDNLYDKNYAEGIYVDIVSGEPLYFSKDKFDSKTGWPSFVAPISAEAVTLHEDNGLFSERTEVRSQWADSHLGHVFADGPAERGGKRYCMNSAALRFIAKEDMEKEGYGYLIEKL